MTQAREKGRNVSGTLNTTECVVLAGQGLFSLSLSLKIGFSSTTKLSLSFLLHRQAEQEQK